MFGVKFEGNLMPGALNPLVGSRQWIPATGTLIQNFLALVDSNPLSDGTPNQKRISRLKTKAKVEKKDIKQKKEEKC